MWKRTPLPDLAATEPLQRDFLSMCEGNGLCEDNALHILMQDGRCWVYLSPPTAIWSYYVSHLADWEECDPPSAEAHLVLRGSGPTELSRFLEEDRDRRRKESG